MSEKIKHIHVRVPEELFLRAEKNLDGRKWQAVFLKVVEKLAGPSKKKKGKK